MKIGIVCYPTFGGSGVLATELGKGLAKKGHQVHFITYKQPVRLAHYQENVFFHEVSMLDYPLFEYPPYDTTLTCKLVDVIKYEGLELLHVHYAIPHATIAYMAKKILLTEGIYIPVITTLHGTDITLVGTNESYKPSVEFGINKSDGVTAVSQSLKDQTLSYFNITNEIEVIPNFVDFNRFKREDKDHFKKAIAPEGEKIVAHVSNFRAVKRVRDVIKVFKNIHDNVPSKLLLIGDGPDREAMQNLCRTFNLCEDIRFLGNQAAVEELLSISDLFLMTSEKESFGLSALEAMACEVPVVSSNAGGLPEVNIHNETGFTADVGDIESMSMHAINLLTNPELHKRMAQKALEHAKNFSLNKILKQYEAYYQQVVASNVWKVVN